MKIIKCSIWDYDFNSDGDYGWVMVKEDIFEKNFDDFILDLINEFGDDYINGLVEGAEDIGIENITGFILRHEGGSKEYVYEIIR